MYGSAKERLALFEKKKEPASSAPAKGPKRIGKLSIGGAKKEDLPVEKKPAAKKEEKPKQEPSKDKAEGATKVTEEGGVKVETTESVGKGGEKIIVTKKTETKTLPSGDKKTTITTETKTVSPGGKTSVQTKTETKTESAGKKVEKKEEKSDKKEEKVEKKEVGKQETKTETKGGVQVETTESVGKGGEKIIVTKKTQTKTLPSGDKETTITTETKTISPGGKTSISTKTETKTESAKQAGAKKEVKSMDKKEEKAADKTVGKGETKKESKDGVDIETTESVGKNGEKIIVTKKTETKVMPNGDKKKTITTETKTIAPGGKISVSTKTETKTEASKESAKEVKEVEITKRGEPKKSKQGDIDVETTECVGKGGEKVTITKKTETKTLPSGEKKITITTETKTVAPGGKISVSTKTETKTEASKESAKDVKEVEITKRGIPKKSKQGDIDVETTECVGKGGEKVTITKKTETKTLPSGEKKITITTETKTVAPGGKISISTKTETRTEGAKQVEKKEAVKVQEKQEVTKKVEEKKEPPKPVEKKEVTKKVEEKKEAVKPAEKKEPPKPAEKKEPPKPVEKKEPPKPAEKKEPPKPAEKKEPPKPAEKKEPPKPVEKKEPPKPAEKKEPPKPVEKKPEEKKEPPKPVEKKPEVKQEPPKPTEIKETPKPVEAAKPVEQKAVVVEKIEATPAPEVKVAKPGEKISFVRKSTTAKSQTSTTTTNKMAEPSVEAKVTVTAQQPAVAVTQIKQEKTTQQVVQPTEVKAQVVQVAQSAAPVTVKQQVQQAGQVTVTSTVVSEPAAAPQEVTLSATTVKTVQPGGVTVTTETSKVSTEVVSQATPQEVDSSSVKITVTGDVSSDQTDAVVVAPEPEKPKREVIVVRGAPVEYVKPSEDLYSALFYFSGMGSLIGESVASGIYVPQPTTKRGLDVEFIEAEDNRRRRSTSRGRELVQNVRGQATDLTADLKRLQSLLQTLPTFGGDAKVSVTASSTTQQVPSAPAPAPPSGTAIRSDQTDANVMILNAQRAAQQSLSQAQQARVVQPPPATHVQSFVQSYVIQSDKAQPAAYSAPPAPFVAAPAPASYMAAPAPAPAPIRPRPTVQLPPREKVVATQVASVQVMPAPAPRAPLAPPAPQVRAPPLSPNRFSQEEARRADAAAKMVAVAAEDARAQDDIRRAKLEAEAAERRRLQREADEAARREAEEIARRAAAATQVKAGGEIYSKVGVYTPKVVGGNRPWQERYGQGKTQNYQPPKPFVADFTIDDSGIKPWQRSRLRAFEARKQHEASENTSAVDGTVQSEGIASLAPYLVSNRTMSMDRANQQLTHQGFSHQLPQKIIKTEILTQQGYPFAREIENSLPYSDL